MQVHPRRERSLALLATGLASGLLLVNPFTGVAQTTRFPDGPSRADKQALLGREAQEIAAAQTAPRPPKDTPKPPRVQAQPLQPRPQREPSTALQPLARTRAGAGTIVESGLAPFPGSLYTF